MNIENGSRGDGFDNFDMSDAQMRRSAGENLAEVNQAGNEDDVLSTWQKQLFVGQIPSSWTKNDLTTYFGTILNMTRDQVMENIKINSISGQKDRYKKHAFIKAKGWELQCRLLSKEIFNGSPVLLNIKESNREEFKRKLFFGRLSDEIKENKLIEMIEKVRPNTKHMIEKDYPQVPDKVIGKSRMAFVVFKTHQAAREVKDCFKKMIDWPTKRLLVENDHLMKLLEDCSQDKNIYNMIRAIDYSRTKVDKKQKSNKSRQEVLNYLGELEKIWLDTVDGIELPTNPSYMDMKAKATADPNDHLPGIELLRLDFYLELALLKTKKMIKFMNEIDGIKDLSRNGRIWLFRNSLAETMVVFNAKLYNPKCHIRGTIQPAVRWIDGIWRGADDLSKCGMTQEVIDHSFDIWETFSDLNLDNKICSLIMTLVILDQDRPVDPSIENELSVMKSIEEDHLKALEIYLKVKYGENSISILGKITLLMKKLRKITNSCLESQLKTIGKMGGTMPDLLAILFNYKN